MTPPETSVTDSQLEPLLLAEELLRLVRPGAEPEGTQAAPWSTMRCVVIGALVPELVDRERVVVRYSTDCDDHTIEVVDGRPTGDEVLDQVLHVLGAGRVAAIDEKVSLANRVWGGRARRRLLTSGKVSKQDVTRWWEGCWRCSEFPELAPTVLRQLLTIYEELWAVHETLYQRTGGDMYSPHFGVGLERRLAARDRFRAVALDPRAPLDARAHYVVALCRGSRMGWFSASLCDDDAEHEATWLRAEAPFANDPLARAVSLVNERWEAQFDC